jgi:hypothetical protein
MRVVITGGSGLIGRHLARSLAGDGREVVVLSRRPEAVAGLPAGARAEGWDGRTAAGWGHLVEGAAVVHLAGEGIATGRWTEARKRRIRESRVESSRAVVEAVGYYGPRGEEDVAEDHPPGADFLARTCVEWEAAGAPVEALGVRRPLLRTGVVLARDGGALPKMLLPFRLFAGGPVGSGRQWMPWIHLADEVGAIRFLLDHPTATGPFNLASPNPVTNREFSRALGRVLRRPSFLPAPAFALRLALGEMADVVLTGQRAVPRRLEGLGYLFRFPTAEAALKDLLG